MRQEENHWTPGFTEYLKADAIKQITELGHSIADVSQRLGVRTHSLYAWIVRQAGLPSAAVKDDQSSDIRRQMQEMSSVTEERDILKSRRVHGQGFNPVDDINICFRAMNEICVHNKASPPVQCPQHVQHVYCSPQRLLWLTAKTVQQKSSGGYGLCCLCP